MAFNLLVIRSASNKEVLRYTVLILIVFIYVLHLEEKCYKDTLKTPKTQFSLVWVFKDFQTKFLFLPQTSFCLQFCVWNKAILCERALLPP